MSESPPTRAPAEGDFFVDLPGVGRFRYGRRTYGDRIRIRQHFLGILGGDDEGVDEDVAAMAAIVAAHRVLCVQAPAGWQELSTIDLVVDPLAEGRILELYALLKQKEDSFRRSVVEAGEGAGA